MGQRNYQYYINSIRDMIETNEFKRWVATLEDYGYVAIDDGGLNIVELDKTTLLPTGANYELGGIPEAGNTDGEIDAILSALDVAEVIQINNSPYMLDWDTRDAPTADANSWLFSFHWSESGVGGIVPHGYIITRAMLRGAELCGNVIYIPDGEDTDEKTEISLYELTALEI